MWVSRHPLNNSLAIFIHGIWGSRWHTWRSYVDFFQRLPSEMAQLRGFDVYLFTYDSPYFGAQPPIRDVAVRELRIFIEREKSRYDTVILVGHSQGGLVAKLYIVEELLQGHAQTMPVDFIITLNTPHRGANWKN